MDRLLKETSHLEKGDNKKELNIYKENEIFVIEMIERDRHICKQSYQTKQTLFEAIKTYRSVIDNYQLSIEEGIGILHRIYYILFA